MVNLFRNGDDAEIISQGLYRKVKITKAFRNVYNVTYDEYHLKGRKMSESNVREALLRPLPPAVPGDEEIIHVNRLVDFKVDKGWKSGVVSDVLSDGAFKVEIPQGFKKKFYVQAKNIRLHKDFNQDAGWIIP